MKKVTIGGKPTANASSRSPDEWVMAKHGPAEPMKRLTIDISLSLHARIKSQCALQNLQMADVIRQMLERSFPAESLPEQPQQLAPDDATETQKPVEP